MCAAHAADGGAPAADAARCGPLTAGPGRIVTEFIERLDLRDVTLCFNDWCGAQVMIADGGVERVGRLALVSCEAFENYPPGLPGRLAGLAAELLGGLAFMTQAVRFRRVRQLP